MTTTALAPVRIGVLGGDAEAIAASGRAWRMVAVRTAAAAAELTALAVVDDFTGDEATTWERRLHGDTADLLDTLASARDIVGGALVAYADELADCQRELTRLTADRADADSAALLLPPGPAVEELRDHQQRLAGRADDIRRRHDDAVRRCCAAITRAADLAQGTVPGVAGLRAASFGAGRGVGTVQPTSTTVRSPLLTAAQLTAVVPIPRPDSGGSDDPEDLDATDWLDPARRQDLWNQVNQHCLARRAAEGIDLDAPISDEGACIGWANSVMATRRTFLDAVVKDPALIEMAKIPETTFGDVLDDTWDFIYDSGLLSERVLQEIFFSGCGPDGNPVACAADIAMTFFPLAKGLRAGARIAEKAAEVATDGDKAVDTGRAAKAADEAKDAEAATAGAKAQPASASTVPPGKIDYIFGKVNSSPKAASRSRGMLAELQRIGIHDNAEGRRALVDLLEDAGRRTDNVVRTFSSKGLVNELRESLLAGPLGFVKVESVWIVEPQGLRLSTVIIKGGER